MMVVYRLGKIWNPGIKLLESIKGYVMQKRPTYEEHVCILRLAVSNLPGPVWQQSANRFLVIQQYMEALSPARQVISKRKHKVL